VVATCDLLLGGSKKAPPYLVGLIVHVATLLAPPRPMIARSRSRLLWLWLWSRLRCVC
jgi:hypothetical protein